MEEDALLLAGFVIVPTMNILGREVSCVRYHALDVFGFMDLDLGHVWQYFRFLGTRYRFIRVPDAARSQKLRRRGYPQHDLPQSGPAAGSEGASGLTVTKRGSSTRLPALNLTLSVDGRPILRRCESRKTERCTPAAGSFTRWIWCYT